jgi:hypothetical protein
MATQAAARRLTEAHRLAQLRLGVGVVAQMRSAWQLVDPEDVEGSQGDWMTTVVPIVQAGKAHSAGLAAAYLRAHRFAETGGYGPDPVQSSGVNLAALGVSMLVTGLYSIRGNLAKGEALNQAMDVGEARTAASAMRYALDGGRETVLETVKADPLAQGFQRVTSGAACDFCAGIADEGVTSKDAEAVSFQAHDGCACSAEPVYL